MFAVIYEFKVKNGYERQFEENWKKLTELIYTYEGSYGSRLHLNEDQQYIAYAQWPSKEVFEKSGDKLPAKANPYRKKMKDACTQIMTIQELEMVDDYLKQIL